jgi:hypothetical protein
MTGGNNAGAGGVAGSFGALTADLGSLQQQGSTNVQMAKAQGLNNAMNTTLGIGNMYGQNLNTFNSGASSALNSGVTAANNADQASTSWMGPVFGALGSAAGGWANGGFKTCWIAKELYGSWLDPRVMFIKTRLTHRAADQWKFKAIVTAYTIFGRPLARLVKANTMARSVASRVFNNFLADEMDFVLNAAVQNFSLKEI